MRNLITFILLSLPLPALSCPQIQGIWKSCSVSSSLLNPLEVLAVNIALKSYSFHMSNPQENILKSKIVKNNIFSSDEVILDEQAVIGENYKSIWERNIIEGSTPPELTIFLSCSNNGMSEYITWDNLSVQNFPNHAESDYPRYFKTVYTRTGNTLVRKIYSKKESTSTYDYLARISCSK